MRLKRAVGHWTIEECLEFLQNRDFQMEDQVTYFDVAEEVALRLSNLLACTRWEDGRAQHESWGHTLSTQEIRETLASTVE